MDKQFWKAFIRFLDDASVEEIQRRIDQIKLFFEKHAKTPDIRSDARRLIKLMEQELFIRWDLVHMQLNVQRALLDEALLPTNEKKFVRWNNWLDDCREVISRYGRNTAEGELLYSLLEQENDGLTSDCWEAWKNAARAVIVRIA